VICLNGAAARLVQVGDTVIIISYALVGEENVQTHTPKVAIMDENNRIKELINAEPAFTVM
jgi:aspartate 1-decarboxylase